MDSYWTISAITRTLGALEVKSASIAAVSIQTILSQPLPDRTTPEQKRERRIAGTDMNGPMKIPTDPSVSATAESAAGRLASGLSIAGRDIATVPKSNQRMFAISSIIFQNE